VAFTARGYAPRPRPGQIGMNRKHLLPKNGLAADAQPQNNRFIALWIRIAQVGQKPATLGYQGQQSLAGTMVPFVRLEVLLQQRQALAQQGNLYFCRPGVGLVALIGCENLPLTSIASAILGVMLLVFSLSRFGTFPEYHTRRRATGTGYRIVKCAVFETLPSTVSEMVVLPVPARDAESGRSPGPIPRLPAVPHRRPAGTVLQSTRSRWRENCGPLLRWRKVPGKPAVPAVQD